MAGLWWHGEIRQIPLHVFWLDLNSFSLCYDKLISHIVSHHSYPYDGTADGSNQYAASPDDAIFKRLASVYASNHAFMANNKVRCECDVREAHVIG